MASESELPLKSGALTIYPRVGEVVNSLGMTVRLGPVNMKILKLLVDNTGQVVARGDLFDQVWKNQSVSDDTLTRCISDIRSRLGKLSENRNYIETIPKRGYRWKVDAGETAAIGNESAVVERARLSSRHRASLAWIGRGLLYVVALVAIATLSAWVVDKLAFRGLPIVVVMPTKSDPSHSDIAAKIEQQISAYVLSLDSVDLLSKTAIQSRPTNPFPYFYHEFGARWLIESELRTYSEQTILTVVLVDARAGIVLLQLTNQFPNGERLAVLDIGKFFEPIQSFVNSRPSH